MKAQPRVFTAKSSVPQAVSSDAMGGGSGVEKSSRLRKEIWWGWMGDKVAEQTKTVNQKPVKIKKDVCLTSGDLVDDEAQ